MSDLNDLIATLCPDGVELRQLRELVKFGKGQSLPEGAGATGSFPVVTAARDAAGSHTECNTEGPCVTVATHGDAGHVNYWAASIWLSNNVLLLTPKADSVIPNFLFQVLKNKESVLKARKRVGGIPYFNASDIHNIVIPVPSLEVQEEIVRVLDSFAALEAELEAELEARRTQYEFYRNQLLTFPEKKA